MNIKHIAFVCIAALAGCASPADTGPFALPEAERLAQRILKSSFRAQGIATLDRLNQDE